MFEVFTFDFRRLIGLVKPTKPEIGSSQPIEIAFPSNKTNRTDKKSKLIQLAREHNVQKHPTKRYRSEVQKSEFQSRHALPRGRQMSQHFVWHHSRTCGTYSMNLHIMEEKITTTIGS